MLGAIRQSRQGPVVVFALVSIAFVYLLAFLGGYEGWVLYFLFCQSWISHVIWFLYVVLIVVFLLLRRRQNAAGTRDKTGRRVTLVAAAFLLTAWWPPYRSFCYGFLTRVATECNAEDLRSWAATEIEKHPDILNDRVIREKECPACLQKLHPRIVIIVEQRGQRYIFVDVRRYWGLDVGTSAIKFPPSEYIYRRCWKPGIFLWCSTGHGDS